MSRRQFQPRSRYEKQRKIERRQDSFRGGMVQDLSPAELPNNAVWDADNWDLFPTRAEVRSGSQRLSLVSLPAIGTGIAASKTGSVVTIASGYTATNADIGRYFVHDSGDAELITGRTGQALTVAVSTAQSASTAGKIRGEPNAWVWHEGLGRFFIHIGTRMYWSYASLGEWGELYCESPSDLPEDTKGGMGIHDGSVYLFNSGGIYKVEEKNQLFYFYKINNAMAGQTIADFAQTETNRFGRRYLYTLSRLDGDYNLNRMTGATVLYESAPNTIGSNKRDFAEVFTKNRVGLGKSTYGILTGGSLGPGADTPAEWEVITDGQAKFTANSETHNVEIDFSGCMTFADVAARVQGAIRAFWVNCTFVCENDHFVFTVPDKDSTVDFCSAGDSGTDIATMLGMTSTTGTIEHEFYDEPLTISPFMFNRLTSSGGFGGRYSHAACSHNGRIYISGGYRDGFLSDVWSSADGKTWREETSDFEPSGFPIGNRAGHQMISCNGKLWIIGGNRGYAGGAANDVWYSSDGVTWAQATAGAAFSPRYDHRCLVYNGKMWVLGGWDGTDTFNDVWHSTDGVTWTEATASAAWSVRCNFGATVFAGKMWVCAGEEGHVMEGGAVYDDIYSSSDGIAWDRATYTPGWKGRFGLGFFMYNSKLWIVGGTTYNEPDPMNPQPDDGFNYFNDIWSSDDGMAWAEASTLASAFESYTEVRFVEHKSSVYLVGRRDDTGIYDEVWQAGKHGMLQVPHVEDGADYQYLNQYTHYSLYATKDVGPEGINPNTGKGNQSELYIWVNDIPIVKPIFGAADPFGRVTAVFGEFAPCDVGDKLTFTNGVSGIITKYLSPTTVVWNQPTVVIAFAAALGTDAPFCSMITGLTVNVFSPDAGLFVSTDVGKKIFWTNGSTSLILSVTTAWRVVVDRVPGSGLWAGAILESPVASTFANRRGFTDNVSDDVLSTRTASYVLKNRMWTPLPDCDLGVITDGFFVVAVKGGRRIQYSQLEDPSLVGYYSEPYQFGMAPDAIYALRQYAGRVVAICAHSTKYWDTADTTNKVIPEIGEVITVMTRGDMVDHSIGTLAPDSICSVENGVDILLTSDAEIRIFDGKQYGKNIAANRMMKLLRKLQNLCAASYDQNGGYLLWGTEGALTTAGSKKLLPRPDICYRFALNDTQGVQGGVRYTGEAWVRPANGIGGLRITDTNGNSRQVVLDNKDGHVYWISTRDGPAGSGLAKVFRDKVLVDGTGGSEISASLKLKGDSGEMEHYLIRHLDSHFYFRPYNEANRGAPGYDANGYRDGTEVDIYFFKNDDPTTSYADTQNIPERGEVCSQENPEAHVIQIQIAVNRSEVVFLGRTSYYYLADKAAEPSVRRKMSEATYQESIAGNLAAWYSRGKSLYMDRVGLATVSGTPATATGPDGKARSAFVLGDALSMRSVALTNGGITLWYSAVVPPTVSINDVPVSLTVHGTSGDWTLAYATGVTGTGVLKIVPWVSTSIFDVRAYTTPPSADARGYYYNDVLNNGGSNVCPRW